MSRRLVSIVPQQSTLLVRVHGIFDAGAGSYQTDATVQVTALVDKYSGEAVTGVTLPIALAYAADWETRVDENGDRVFDADGNYEGTIPHGNSMEAERFYYATIQVTSAAGRARTFREEIEITAGEA